MRDAMVEVLTRDDYVQAWTVSVSGRRLFIEHRSESGLTSTKTTLTWEGGRWEGEVLVLQPPYRRAVQSSLPPERARAVLATAVGLLTAVRGRFGADAVTIPLGRFGSP
jgi:hypothetical protein